MKRMYGVVIPMVTPLTEDDHVDVLSLQRLTDFLIDKGVDCLYPCGTTGEMAYLTDDERILVVETVVRQAAGRVPVFAQVGAANTSSTIRLAQHAAACGADGVGVVTPWYFQLSDDALLSYYKEVSDSVPADFPIYMYGIPQNAVNDITPALAERVAQACPNVVGVKYSYPDMTRLQQLMTVRNGAFDVLVGPDHLYEAVVAVGGKGVISGNAMIVSEHYVAVREAMARNDWASATRLQRKTNVLNAILCAKNNIGCYKAILKQWGIIETARMRKPMEEVSAEDTAALLKALEEAEYKTVPAV